MRFLMLVSLVLSIIGCDSQTSHYQNYQEAKAGKLFFDRWLPDILPRSTVDIVTKHNLKTNTSTGQFTIPERDLPKFIYNLNPINNKTYSYGGVNDSFVWIFRVEDNGVVHYTLKSRTS